MVKSSDVLRSASGNLTSPMFQLYLRCFRIVGGRRIAPRAQTPQSTREERANWAGKGGKGRNGWSGNKESLCIIGYGDGRRWLWHRISNRLNLFIAAIKTADKKICSVMHSKHTSAGMVCTWSKSEHFQWRTMARSDNGGSFSSDFWPFSGFENWSSQWLCRENTDF